ncbi:ATP-binding protein [Natronococcus occultus]|uniref:Uncharacterized protein n=1 Tax=Natronococcus occultus SP4 TaxID=694430 RepID=L0JZ62_9EURY|nr:ATP-binding protein [Natronococcus occultus]AGB38051.1 hypothetical protein Natoc_2273 [Natronococcus occultus SP4]
MRQAKLNVGLLNELKSLKTSEQVEDFLEQHDLEWKHLGGRDTNENSVHMVKDPANALNERVTNAIDACLERAVHENKVDSASSPREAVTEVFGLSKAGYNDMSPHWVKDTADSNINVAIEENSKPNRPVIEISDQGIGQQPQDFEDTFLSLDRNTKLTKPYLIGKYGQGGSSTFAFCEYAIIISRHCDGGDVGWSIVRYNERTSGDEEYSLGVYEYCVLPNGDIPSIPESEVDDLSGSIVRLIEYDATNFKNSLSAGAGNLYTVLHRTMFGSIFPFMLEDRRVERFKGYNDKPKRRTVVGSRYRLDKPSKYVDKSRDFRRVDLGEYGALRIKYWVLNDRSAVEQFADPTEPIVFTLDGQRHHTETKRYFKDGTGFNFLKDRIIVEVNCEDLSHSGKRAFTSDRESMADSDQGRVIRRKVIEALAEDDQLDALNENYKHKAIRETSSEQEERAKDLLADLLQNPKEGDEEEAPAEGGDEEEEEPVYEGGDGEEDEGPEELHDYPTYVKIINKQTPIPAKQGRTVRVKIEVDADWKFEELERGEITLDLSDVDGLTYNRETTLEDGRKYIYAKVDENAEIGESGVITAVVEWEDGRFEDERDLEIVEPPKTTSTGGAGELQSPEITQVTENNNSLGWDETDVVEFHPDEGDTGRVYVSMFNENIEPVLEDIPTEDTARQRKSEYTGYMAYYEVMRETEAQEVDADIDETYVKQEQNRVAKVLMRQIVDGMTPEVM